MHARARKTQAGGGWGRAYVLVLFLLCSTLSYADRQTISLVVEPLKRALGLSETEVGLLQGLAFSLCYAVAGLPLAIAIDRTHRARLAAAAVAIWSAASAACGVVVTYPGFLTARAVTAVSEAGFSPAALSILSDINPPRKIARASALYLLGPSLGTGTALLAGGAALKVLAATGGLTLPLFGHLPPWKGLFLLVAAPGPLLALLVLLTVREPARTGSALGDGDHDAKRTSGRSILATYGGFLAAYVIGTCLIMLVQFAAGAWAPTFFVRRFALVPAEVGGLLGPVSIAMSLLGVSISSLLINRPTAHAALGRALTISLCAGTLVVLASGALPFARTLWQAVGCYGVQTFGCSLVATIATAPLLLAMPSHLRGRATAAGGFFLAVVSGGGGPLAVGLATDYLFRDPRLVGQSLGLVCAISAAAGMAVILVARRCLRDLPETPAAALEPAS